MSYGRSKETKKELEQGTQKHDKAKLQEKIEKIEKKYGDLVERYCNNIPARMVMARIQIESGGNPRATAKAQQWRTGFGSEIGLLMISPDSRKYYGLTEQEVKIPETNIKYGCLIWNKWTKNFFNEVFMPEEDVVAKGTWAWLVTSIGPGASRRLRKLANGYELGRLEAVVKNQELMERNKRFWGSQSPQLVAWRVGSAIGIARLIKPSKKKEREDGPQES